MNPAELDLSPYEFDQTDKGWPILDKKRHYLEAAQLIESYIESNVEKINQQSEVSLQTLHFHAGQEYAMAGREYYDNAIKHIEQSYKSSESWNLYVKGTLAYLANHYPVLVEKSDHLSELAKNDERLEQNSILLKRFASALSAGQYDYATVYGHK